MALGLVRRDLAWEQVEEGKLETWHGYLEHKGRHRLCAVVQRYGGAGPFEFTAQWRDEDRQVAGTAETLEGAQRGASGAVLEQRRKG